MNKAGNIAMPFKTDEYYFNDGGLTVKIYKD